MTFEEHMEATLRRSWRRLLRDRWRIWWYNWRMDVEYLATRALPPVE